MMKCYLISFVVLFLALSGCGKGDKPGPATTNNPPAPAAVPPVPTPVAALAGGQDTPENALRAYVRVLREGDFEAFQAIFCQNPKEVADYVRMIEYLCKDLSPAAIAIQKSVNLEAMADSNWPDGHYKVFSAELQGDDQASIVEVFDNPTTKTPTYSRYGFKKIAGKWYPMGHELLDAAKVDKAKYPPDIAPGPDWADAGPKDLMPSKPKEVPKPGFTMTDEEFARQFKADAKKAAAKYANQWVELDGTVLSAFSPENSRVLLGATKKTASGIEMSMVVCDFAQPARWQAEALTPTQKVKVLGQYPEGRSESQLFECRIVSAGTDPAIGADAARMAAELVADRDATEKKYNGKQLLIEGLVDEVEKEQMVGHVLLERLREGRHVLPGNVWRLLVASR